MKRYALSVLFVLLFALKLCAQNTGVQQFNVRTYGAKGDGTTLDTQAIKQAVAAAEAFTTANAQGIGEVLIPRGTYIISDEITIVGDRIKLSGNGTVKTQDGDSSMTSMIDVTGDDFAIDGVTIDGNDVGASDGAHCLRVAGTNNTITNVICANAKDTGFQVHTGSLRTTIRDCVSDSCNMGLRVNGDYCDVTRLFVYDFTAEKGATIDPQICDAQYFSMTDCYFHTLDNTWECFVLVDTSDGGLVNNPDNTQKSTIGAPTDVGGNTQYTVPAGHGYQPGDGFRLTDSGDTSWNRNHKIIGVTGNKIVRKLSDTTFALYDTAAQARDTTSTTGRLDITSGGGATAGVDFYVTTPLGGQHVVTVNTGLDYTDDIFTTNDNHNFQTGEMIRITPHSRLHVLPTGIRNGGTVLLKSPYASAGTSANTATFRPKRIEQVVISNLVCQAPNEALNDGNMIKVNNCNNLTIKGSTLQHPLNKSISSIDDNGTPMDPSDDFPLYYDVQSIRFGANVRNVTLQDLKMSDGVMINVYSNVFSLLAENCIFGDSADLDSYCIQRFSAQRAVFRSCTFRCSLAAIEYEMRDTDLEWLEFDNCSLEGQSSTVLVGWLNPVSDSSITPKIRMGGKFYFRPNNRRINLTWPGTTVSSFNNTTDVVTLSTIHALDQGDEVYFTTTSSLPANVVSNSKYYWRPTGNTTGTLHTSRSAASDAAATPFDLGAGGSNCTMHTPGKKLGTSPTRSGVTDLLARCQGSTTDLYDVTTANATSGSFVMALPAGTRIWNPNAGRNSSPGWIVTTEGIIGSTVNVLQAMPMLNSTFVANITEDGNDGTGEDNLLSYALPANTLAATGDSIEIEAGFTFANNTATKQVKIFIGANEIYASGASAHQSGGMQFRAVVVRDAVNTAKISLFATANGSNTPFPIAYGNAFNQASIDWSTALTIKGTGEATNDNDIVMEYLRVRAFPAAPP